MTDHSIYKDIAQRTGGDIYVGVVGPVRSGKSTLIKKFMESVVIPNIPGEHDKTRARDELPQSAGGRTVMTTEPKFIPNEAVQITVGDSGRVNVRMIDCVGYLIPDAIGNTENGTPRMVHTPWSEEAVPFDVAAETGTRKVILEHSTIGLLVTTDGSFGEIPRSNYVEAEQRVARELRAIGKPFAVILNSAHPDTEESEALAMSLEKEYGAPVALVNCMEINAEDITQILHMILMEFPVREICLRKPEWMAALETSHWLCQAVFSAMMEAAKTVTKMGQMPSEWIPGMEKNLQDALQIKANFSDTGSVHMESMELGNGSATLTLSLPQSVYYRVLSELTDMEISTEKELISILQTLSASKKTYAKYEEAIRELDENGYGIVMPAADSLVLEEPQIVRQAGGYGVRLRASAPSIHLIKATIETEINPIVGTEQQSEELVKNLLQDFEGDPEQIWNSNLFGKTLYELVNDGLHAKVAHMSEDARVKLGEALSRVINEGSSGLICIIL